MKLWHYFNGEIKIRLEGNTPERFFNICNANGIEIRSIEYWEGHYYFKMFPGDYKRLAGVVRKTSMRPVIIEKQGLPFVLFRYRKHQCFVVGIMLSFFIIYMMSLFVWDISFDGNLIYSDDVLLNYLEENGIRHGMLMKGIDCDEIEKQFRRQFEDITWVSAEVSGTRLIIHIKENDEDVIAVMDTTPCDLVASKSGTVESIITRSGTPMAKPGDEVSEGDILVSGTVNTYDDYETVIGSRMVHADADILINTVYEYESVLNKKYDYKIYTGNSKEMYYLEINGKMVFLGFKPDYETAKIVSADNQVKLTGNFYLPIRYGRREYVEYYVDSNIYTQTEAEAILNRRLEVFLENLTQKGVQILENDVKINENAASYSYIGRITVIEPAYTESEPAEYTEGTREDEYN